MTYFFYLRLFSIVFDFFFDFFLIFFLTLPAPLSRFVSSSPRLVVMGATATATTR